jgi:hypothetical protein
MPPIPPICADALNKAPRALATQAQQVLTPEWERVKRGH